MFFSAEITVKVMDGLWVAEFLPDDHVFMFYDKILTMPSSHSWAPVVSLYCQNSGWLSAGLSLSHAWEHSHIPSPGPRHLNAWPELSHLGYPSNSLLCPHTVSEDILRLKAAGHDAKSGYWPRSKVPSQVPTITAHWAGLSSVERTQSELWLVETQSVQLMQLHT